MNKGFYALIRYKLRELGMKTVPIEKFIKLLKEQEKEENLYGKSLWSIFGITKGKKYKIIRIGDHIGDGVTEYSFYDDNGNIRGFYKSNFGETWELIIK